jgi:pantothenate synthetase
MKDYDQSIMILKQVIKELQLQVIIIDGEIVDISPVLTK